MNRLGSKVVLVAAFGALLWPAGRASAVCSTSLADPSIDCKAALKCQQGVSKAAFTYVNAVQKAGAAIMGDSQAGKITAFPVTTCQGGANAGKPCVSNNGVCKTKNVGKVCNADADCGAGALCDRTKGCNPAPAVNDASECGINNSKSTYAKANTAAQATLLKSIQTACAGVDATSIGLTVACPGVTAADQPKALADCIAKSIDGDLVSGNVVDTNTRLFTVSTGSGSIAPKSKTLKDPRAVIELQGSQSLQIGNGAGDPTSNGLASGGGVVALYGAHCVGGNGNGFCLNDKDCGTDSGGLANGVCTPNAVVGGELTLTGAPVHNPADPNSFGNLLSISATCGGGVATCLVTRTKNAGNGTTTAGSINLTTGHYQATSPISTDVYVDAPVLDCNAFGSPCPYCDVTKHCHAGSGGSGSTDITRTCDAAPGAITTQCPVSGTTIAGTVPNPFSLATDTPPLNPAPGQGTKFCGFCDTSNAVNCQAGNSVCAVGCQTAAECDTKLGSGGHVCDFNTSVIGFHGDTGVSTITAAGADRQYTPFVSGLFCTGITNNGLVDSAAGLPGPVRVSLPYLFGYIQTKDP